MEHWGLVTFREVNLLYERGISSTVNKMRVAMVIGHELAHMWFGNLSKWSSCLEWKLVVGMAHDSFFVHEASTEYKAVTYTSKHSHYVTFFRCNSKLVTCKQCSIQNLCMFTWSNDKVPGLMRLCNYDWVHKPVVVGFWLSCDCQVLVKVLAQWAYPQKSCVSCVVLCYNAAVREGQVLIQTLGNCYSNIKIAGKCLWKWSCILNSYIRMVQRFGEGCEDHEDRRNVQPWTAFKWEICEKLADGQRPLNAPDIGGGSSARELGDDFQILL